MTLVRRVSGRPTPREFDAPIIVRIPYRPIKTFTPTSNSLASVGTAIRAAQDAAANAGGGVIEVWASATVTQGLGENGVNWYFAPGVTITHQGTGQAGDYLWGDLSGVTSFSVGGWANFVADNSRVGLFGNASTVKIHCLSCKSTQDNMPCFYTEGSVSLLLRVMDFIESSAYDGFWHAGGSVDVEARAIIGGDNAIEMSGNAASYLRVRADRIANGDIGSSTTVHTVGTASKFDIVSRLIENTGGGPALDLRTTTASRLEAQRIVGAVTLQNNVTLINADVDASASAVTALTVGSPTNTPTLRNVRIIAEGSSNAIGELSGTPTVNVAGTLTRNRPVSSSVTINRLSELHGSQTLTDGANIAWNLQQGTYATVTLADNRTLSNPTNQVAGLTCTLKVIQDGTGSRTLSYGNAYKFAGGSSPTLTTSANAVDILEFKSDGTNMHLTKETLDLQ